MDISVIDPPGCGCSTCKISAGTIPLDQATYEQLSDMIMGSAVNNTGMEFVRTSSYGAEGQVIKTICCAATGQLWHHVEHPPRDMVQTRTRFKREKSKTPSLAEMTSDEMVVAVLKYVAQLSATRDPAARLQLVAQWLQPAIGELLRRCVTDCRTIDLPWVQIAELMDTNYAAVHRQYLGGGPMLSASSRVSYIKEGNSE